MSERFCLLPTWKMDKLLSAWILLLATSVLLIPRNESACVEDEVRKLDGLPDLLPIVHYSGYLKGSNDDFQLHYWLIEARTSPQRNPLILWLSGGPGCSSLEELLLGSGPFNLPKDGGGMVENKQSWYQFASLLYLEAPAGVGFSYSLKSERIISDDTTSLNNYYALRNFLEKFPEYEGTKLFIAGEGYAGIYVPTLALRIIQDPLPLALKGIILQNGLTSYRNNDNSALYFLNNFGFFDQKNWTDLLDKCCQEQSDAQCFFTDSRDSECPQRILRMMDELYHGLNPYNIHARCPGGWTDEQSAKAFRYPVMGHMFRTISSPRNTGSASSENEPPKLPCRNLTYIHDYLNRKSVRRQLHINEANVGYWEICNSRIAAQYDRQYFDLSEQYTLILRAGVSVLIYYGDLDVIYNHIGSKWFVNGLGAKVEEPMHRLSYVEKDFTTQHGGFKKVFDVNGTKLWYVTVRGSGHRVSDEQAALVYGLIQHFVTPETEN